MTIGSCPPAKSKNSPTKQAVQRVIQQFSHPISAADISRHFAAGKKAANVAREQQIGHMLETICTLGLLSAALSC